MQVVICPNGCDFKGNLKDLKESHLNKDCPYEPAGCPLSGCQLILHKRNQIPAHTRNCEFRLYQCPDCKEPFTFKEYKSNHEVICQKRYVLCKQCALPIPVRSL